MMFTPYDESTASLEDRIAWVLCQIIDDDAPLRWTQYRSTAVCIATNPKLMAALKELAKEPKESCKHCGESEPWIGLCDRMGDLCEKAARR